MSTLAVNGHHLTVRESDVKFSPCYRDACALLHANID
jgi:hypothetical protein